MVASHFLTPVLEKEVQYDIQNLLCQKGFGSAGAEQALQLDR